MPLNKLALEGDLLNIFSTHHPSHAITAAKVSVALGAYWAQGIHAAQAGIVSPAAAIGIVKDLLTIVWGPPLLSNSAVSTAKDVADAIEKGVLALTLAGAPYGTGGVSSASGAAGIVDLTAGFAPTALITTFTQTLHK